MPGVGQPDQPAVAAGASATPLVTPADSNVLGTDAVTQLVDQFRKGFITQDDIINRVGDIGQAKNKALLQELGEYVSPEAINARHQQNILAGTQAGAQTGLVEPAAEAQRWALERQKWNTVTNGGVDAFQQYAYLFGHNEMPKKADGTPDFEKMGSLGQTYLYPLHMAQMAEEALKPTRTVDTKGPNGETGQVMFNAWGRNITPGSPDFIALTRLASLVPANSVKTGVTPQGKLGATENDLVGPAPAASEGAPTSSLAGFTPGLGVVTKAGSSVQEARDMLDKNSAFKIWEGNKGNIDAFHNIVHTIEHPKSTQERLEAERGLVYTLSELQQNMAQGSIPRSVIGNWENIVAHPNITDSVKNAIGKVTGNTPLTHDQIKSLISLGSSMIAGKTTAALGGLKLAKKLNPSALTDDEQDVLDTGGMSEISGHRAENLRSLQKGQQAKVAAAQTYTKGKNIPAGTVLILKDGSRVTSLGGGSFMPSP